MDTQKQGQSAANALVRPPSHLPVVIESDDGPPGVWLDEGNTLHVRGLTTNNIPVDDFIIAYHRLGKLSAKSKFAAGHLLMMFEGCYNDIFYNIIDERYWSYSTQAKMRMVAKRFPPDRLRWDLSWSYYAEVCVSDLTDDDQCELLQRASEGEFDSREQFRVAVRQRINDRRMASGKETLSVSKLRPLLQKVSGLTVDARSDILKASAQGAVLSPEVTEPLAEAVQEVLPNLFAIKQALDARQSDSDVAQAQTTPEASPVQERREQIMPETANYRQIQVLHSWRQEDDFWSVNDLEWLLKEHVNAWLSDDDPEALLGPRNGGKPPVNDQMRAAVRQAYLSGNLTVSVTFSCTTPDSA